MTITKTINGYLHISDIINNQYVHRLFIGYTHKEAIAEFKEYCKNL